MRFFHRVSSILPLERKPYFWATSTKTMSSSRIILPFATSSSFPNNVIYRSKHSSRQIKRLFLKNPARRRIVQKQLLLGGEDIGQNAELDIPQSNIQPVSMTKPIILPNGWNRPLNADGRGNINLPFQVSRTQRKPNNSLGFLPVYAEYRKDGARVTTRIKRVSGDRDFFLNELRAALQIPISSKNSIRIRTGGTVEVKGNRVQEVQKWLGSLGF